MQPPKPLFDEEQRFFQLNPQVFILQEEVRTEREQDLTLVLERAGFEALLGFPGEEEVDRAPPDPGQMRIVVEYAMDMR